MKELTPDEHRILVDAIQDSATVVHKGRKDMNERIKKLAEQCRGNPMTSEFEPLFDKAKFAELIIKECANAIVNDSRLSDVRTARNGCVRTIKEHFGVEE
jgi:hypothetical protein